MTRGKAQACFSNPVSRGKRGIGNCRAGIVHTVAPIPDSLKIWFYGDKRYEEGKAFGC